MWYVVGLQKMKEKFIHNSKHVLYKVIFNMQYNLRDMKIV